MRFLVLGASGMAGHLIALYLNERGHEVRGFSRREVPYVPNILGDAMDESLLAKVISKGSFEVIVNAIGILNAAADEDRDRAVYLNSYLPHHLSSLTAGSTCRVVHLSTDCVFSGSTGPYREDSLRDGESFYDRTKALGELADDGSLTLRNSIVGPDINEDGIGLLNWFMKQSDPVRGFCNVMWTGLTTLELAKAIEFAAESGASGLMNLVPPMSISKYELLELFNTHLRPGRMLQIIPCDEPHIDKTLVRTNHDLMFEPASYERMVTELAEWICTHQSLYPEYYQAGR